MMIVPPRPEHCDQVKQQVADDHGKRAIYAYLFLLFGGVFGLHNFYLCRWRPGFLQLAYTSLLIALGVFLAWTSLGSVLSGSGATTLLSTSLLVWAVMAAVLVLMMAIDALKIPDHIRYYHIYDY